MNLTRSEGRIKEHKVRRKYELMWKIKHSQCLLENTHTINEVKVPFSKTERGLSLLDC